LRRDAYAAPQVPATPVANLCVPKTSSTSCDQAIFVDQATDASVSSDAILIEVCRPVRFQNSAVGLDLGLRGPLVFVDEAAEDGSAPYPLFGEVGGGMVGPGRAELAAAVGSSSVVVGLVLGQD